MVRNKTAQAAGAATAGVERALGILGQRATPKSVKKAVAVLGRVLDDMRTVCIDLTGDDGEQESIGHGAVTVRYGRTKRSNAHKDTAGAPDGSHCAGARHVNTVPDARAKRLASRHQAADDAQDAPAQHQVCKLIVTGLLCHCW